MIWLISWLFYGFIVGFLAKRLYREKENISIWATLCLGVGGSYVGGFLHYVVYGVGTPFAPSGILFGLIGAVLLLFVYHKLEGQNG